MKESFIMFTENLELVKELTDEQAGQLYKAILLTESGEATEPEDVAARVAYKAIMNQIDRCDRKYEETRMKRSEAGKKAMGKRWGETLKAEDADRIMNAWNALESTGITPIKSISGKRRDALRARIAEHGIDAVIAAMDQVRTSEFLRGQNDRGWRITFDWFCKPTNFQKVAEGNYKDHGKPQKASGKTVPYVGRQYDWNALERDLMMAQKR